MSMNVTGISQGPVCDLRAGVLEKVVLPCLYTVIIFVGVPANFLATWKFMQQSHRRHGVLIYLMNLSMADLISCLALPFRAALLLWGDGWNERSVVCTTFMIIVNFSFYYTVSCSTVFLAFTSVSRYAMIVKPNNRRLNRFYETGFAKWGCGLTWALTVLPVLSLNLNYFISEMANTLPEEQEGDRVCYSMRLQYGKRVSAMGFATVAVLFLLLLAAFAFSYASIALHLCTIRRRSLSQRNRVIHVRAQMIIIAAMTGFVVCHLPYHVYQLVTSLRRLSDIHCQWLLDTHHVKLITLWFVSLSSCLNPILYYLLSKSFVEGRR
ncbi:probable G-protein coupled receptor 82 [Callorhinchus milii]|uniref:probable G-protein coupled receptor 82 n=1 Tax=Callorhinchus milii TaxID=7868 RepID=UPI0004574FB7|nr:probable G-protein coupled receptor 82 [Callorhinchus milii]|eukprot:gi/632969250/ref/XP_007900986.1/ PREDICTED: probable G-protein coupled receptor 82 [Callorhinchus milii]